MLTYSSAQILPLMRSDSVAPSAVDCIGRDVSNGDALMSPASMEMWAPLTAVSMRSAENSS